MRQIDWLLLSEIEMVAGPKPIQHAIQPCFDISNRVKDWRVEVGAMNFQVLTASLLPAQFKRTDWNKYFRMVRFSQ